MPGDQHRNEKAKNQGFERVVFVLQGGGALGAYQAGAFEALTEAGYEPDWISGISIGAANSAIIAGNPPGKRVEKLRELWDTIVTQCPVIGAPTGSRESMFQMPQIPPLPMFEAWPHTAMGPQKVTNKLATFQGDPFRQAYNMVSGWKTMMYGQPGFFRPWFPPPFFQQPGSVAATSFYDTSDFRKTLENLVDFDLINARKTRLSVGAVNVRTGNFVYFDNFDREIRPEHIMASGALPPGFPAVEIDGEFYWDGGLVSNTPLTHVMDEGLTQDTLCFQVDLFCARGGLPRTIPDVQERQKDISYSSRTRAITDSWERYYNLRHKVNKLLDKLPAELREDPEVQALWEKTDHSFTIVHLIYRSKNYEADNKDYEFSRKSMHDHWRAGRNDTMRTLRHDEWLRPPTGDRVIATHDLMRDAED